MTAASYYSGDVQSSHPPTGPQNTYGGRPQNISSIQLQSQPYTGSAYNGPNEGPALYPVEPLLDKPTNNKPPSTQHGPQKLQMVDPSLNRIRYRRFQQWKRYLRIGKLLTRATSIAFTAIMFGIMVFITAKYQTTKDTIRGGPTAWPKNPKLWPTFMLLAASGATLIVSLTTLLASCCTTNFNKVQRSWKLTVLKYVIHIAGWIVVSITYRYEKSLHGSNNDL